MTGRGRERDFVRERLVERVERAGSQLREDDGIRKKRGLTPSNTKRWGEDTGRKERRMKALGLSHTKCLRVALTVAAVAALAFFAAGEETRAGNKTASAKSFALDVLVLSPAFGDEFNDPNLDPKFFFDNPGPDPASQSFSLTENPGFLRITTTGPTDLWGGNNSAPKILEGAPAGNFQITSRVLASPDVTNEHAGILVMQDSTHWVRLIRDSRNDSVFLQEGPNNDVSFVPFSGGDVILRLTRVGSNYQGGFSTNGIDFTQVGTTVNPLTPAHIGMSVVSTPPGNVFSADFDYFRVVTGMPDGVGGIADLPPLAETTAEGSAAPADGSGWTAGAYAALAGGLAAAAVALGGGAWYARRRWLH